VESAAQGLHSASKLQKFGKITDHEKDFVLSKVGPFGMRA